MRLGNKKSFTKNTNIRRHMIMNELCEQIVEDFYLWLKVLKRKEVAKWLEVPESKIYRYSRMTIDELGAKITLREVAALDKLVTKIGFEYTDAPRVRVEEKITVED